MSQLKKYSFIFSYSIPLVILASFYVPSTPWTFSGFLYAYAIIPMVDFIIGKDRNNVLKNEFDTLLSDRYFDFLVISHVYIQYAMLIWVAYVVSTSPLSYVQFVGLMVSQGVYGGTIINVAHELGHRKPSFFQRHAKAALISVSYIHFIVEHNRGHHVHVATPLDPATSKKDQTLYAFWKQTLVGSFKSALKIERSQLERKKQAFLSFHNTILKGHIFTIVLFSILSFLPLLWQQPLTWKVPAALWGQAAIGILLLETVNYIEHYGIVRREITPGKYERVNPLHSWNANHYFSNLILFNLQRHSDHHAYASRPYQVLRHFDESPQLPFGYPLMIVMATWPRLWFKVMNKKLEAWQERAYNKEHIAVAIKRFA